MITKFKRIMIVSGEASGDKLGAELIDAIQSIQSNIRFFGVGGEYMEKMGVKSLFPLSDISVMGITEIIPKISIIYKRIKDTVAYAIEQKPDVLVVIDSLDFTHSVAKRVKASLPNTKIIRYVAPKLWAWRPYRAKKLKGIYDKLLVLFPFEVDFFTKYDIESIFVGHPVVNRITPPDEKQKSAFMEKYNLNVTDHIVSILPGSRADEIKRLLPIFIQVALRLQHIDHKLQVLLPTVENMSPLVNSILQTYGFKCQMITNADERFTAMSLSTCALAASGTVSLELMAASTPAVIAYKIGTFTGFMVRYLISVKYVTILNIMLDRKIIPEHLQENCTMENIMISLEKLLECEDTRNIQLKAYQKGLKMLGAYDESPALRAAKEVTSLLFNGG